MNQTLIKNNYLLVPNFLSIEQAEWYASELKRYTRNLAGDEQVPKSRALCLAPFNLNLLCNSVPRISSILEDDVLPSYTYGRVYLKGAILHPHLDRPSCEISLTIHLDGDQTWPIYFTKPNGKVRSVKLNKGDAVMYLGMASKHWRFRYRGELYCQLFLHYVRTWGPNWVHFFDKDAKAQ